MKDWVQRELGRLCNHWGVSRPGERWWRSALDGSYADVKEKINEKLEIELVRLRNRVDMKSKGVSAIKGAS